MTKKGYCLNLDSEVHTEFQTLCTREGSSASEKLRDFEFTYVQAHCQGNPQPILQQFIEQPKLECFRCRGKFQVLYSVEYVSGLLAKVCNECLEKDRKRGVVRKVMTK